MTATLPIPENAVPAPARPAVQRSVAAPHAPPDRLDTLRQLAAALQAAVAHWAEDSPDEVWRRLRELDRLRHELSASPELPPETEASAGELLRALSAAAKEVRRINEVYMTLLREAQRAIGVRLRHLSAYAPVYAPGAGPESLFWDAPNREVRA
ncbi:MAG: hypothetical protein ACRD2E_03080 [Terriglobales bacterium]